MKTFLVPALAAACLAFATPAMADLPLPAPSPKAGVSQTVGITDVTVDYSSPGVKGRKVFGGLVPYGELWRTGANAATKITFSRDVTVGGKPVGAGTYSIFTIPTAKSWTFILNSNKDATTQAYDQKLDVVRLEVKPEKAPKRERLVFLFSNTSDTETRLDLEWEETRVSVAIKADTAAQTLGVISAHMDQTWRPLAQAARYLMESGAEPAKALAAADASLAVKETWYNLWIKAQILAKGNDFKAAFPLAQKAFDLGQKDQNFFWKADIEKALGEWKSKI